jgi:glyoxylase-like metal-dependent hydrolase (beta-lactamase superfamily II)
VDPGGDVDHILRVVDQLGVRVKAIVATHGHPDHVMGVGELRARTGAPFYIHPADEFLLKTLEEESMEESLRRLLFWTPLPPEPPEEFRPDHPLEDRGHLTLGAVKLTVLHTPGHSPGSICLHTSGHLFTGDTLFAGSVGRTDLPGGDPQALARSLHKILTLPDETQIYPGHGPTTTLREERHTNPYLKENL